MKPWLIKVLNGPNAGAQILVSKEVSVGTSIDCDLILNDPHISALHCQLKKGDADEFEIIPKEGVVFVNGKKLEEATGKLLLGEVLTIGSTHLTGGPSEQLWPPITIPEIQEIGGVWQPVVPSPTSVVLNNDPKEVSKKRAKLSKKSLRIIILILFCIWLGSFLLRVVNHRNLIVKRSEFRPSSFEKEESLEPKNQLMLVEATASDLRKKLPKDYIKTVERNGEYIIYIYVRNQIEYDLARKVMNSQAILVPSNIINIDDIDDSAGAMMKALNFSVDVSVDHRGKATWYGYLPNNEALDSIKNQIARDIPAITEDEYHIILGNEAVKKTHNILQQNQFGNIVAAAERNNITLAGTISSADKTRWKKTLKELEREFLGGVQFANMVTVSTGVTKVRGFFNAPVVSVSISSTPYVVLQNGERIFIGAQVNDGYVVSSITTEAIELTNSEEKKFIPLIKH
ncbi:MAG: type III secretion system inner membrane ring subunit SctD [Chthoniobacterales bacterium]